MTRLYFIIGIFSGIVFAYFLVFLLFPEADFFNIFEKEQSYFNIPDECGTILGNVMHTVADEDKCKMQCRAKCSTVDQEYSSVVFKKETNMCNSCECYCN